MSDRTQRGDAVLGAFGRFPTSPPGRFYGARVANDDFLTAVLHYGGMQRVELFVPPSDLAEARRFSAGGWANARYAHRVPVRVHKTMDLLGGLDRYRLSAWHDTFSSGGLPFHIRRLMARKPYPVTLGHHTVSYPGMLTTFLRLLTDEVEPFDALVCTTRSARTAIERLIDLVRGRFRGTHALDLRFRASLPVIPLGVNTDFLRPHGREETRRQLGIAEQTFVMLWLGRVSAADKADLLPLLRVLRRLTQANPRRRLLLLVAGKGRERDSANIEDYATSLGVRQSVRLLTELPHDDKPRLLSAADVFVSPTDNVQEMFGITPIEAMACGLPQVVSDWDGYAESVVHGETGFRIPTYWAPCDGDIARVSFVPGYDMLDHRLLAQSVAVDVQLYCRRIQQLIDSPQLLKRMSQASRERALALYDWSQVIPQWDALWRDLGEKARHAAPSQRVVPWDSPSYFEAFERHATLILGEDARVRLTADGRPVADGTEQLPLYYADGRLLSGQLAGKVLACIADQGNGGLAIDAVLYQTARGGKRRDTVFRHLLWLLKHGLIEVAATGSGRRAAHADELFETTGRAQRARRSAARNRIKART
jgi:glycosyltransferase involved in cell wall biosynthesis